MAVNLGKSFYQLESEDEEFNRFCDCMVEEAKKLKISEPRLPHYRKAPASLADDFQPHQYCTPRHYFLQRYCEASDSLIMEVEARFEQKELLKPVHLLESLLLK